MPSSSPLILLNVVGLTSRLLPHAPRLARLAANAWIRPLREVLPAVTSTAQATILTGKTPHEHGIVANGWLFRETMEVRFWQQSNRLLQAPPIYQTLRRKFAEAGREFRCAKLFWWFNQGADVAISVTPKPWYGADGDKAFGIAGAPGGLVDSLERDLGEFPFFAFWGPKAGLPATQWIAGCAAKILEEHRPDLTLAYLPHLDYDPQRFGPLGCDSPRCVKELDDACEPIFRAAERIGARIWAVSEYGHCQATQVCHPNRLLRKAGLLRVRPGPFGETLDAFESRAIAVCDHQFAHVYVSDPADLSKARDVLTSDPVVARVLAEGERREIALDHPRSGELIALSRPDGWFAYPYWLDDRLAPDFARTVDIHRKIGFDPCEMFVDPKLHLPLLRMARRLIQKKLGFRTLFDVVPLDASLVQGTHGLPAADPLDRPVLIGDGPPPKQDLAMTDVYDRLLEALT